MLNLNYTMFILGADDPEMSEIEKFLKNEARNIIYACVNNYRVAHHTAYGQKFDSIFDLQNSYEKFIFVECSDIREKEMKIEISHVDHHNPGDPGYGFPKEKFWEASSIGQIWNMFYPDLTPNLDLMYTAAADQNLRHAYQIYPKLENWRIKEKSKFENRKEEDIQTEFRFAKSILKRILLQNPPYLLIGGKEVLDLTPGFEICVAPNGCSATRFIGDKKWIRPEGKHKVHNLRKFEELRGMSDMACKLGIPILTKITENGRRKIFLRAAEEETVKDFLSYKHLTDVFGDPCRGFAGGYLK